MPGTASSSNSASPSGVSNFGCFVNDCNCLIVSPENTRHRKSIVRRTDIEQYQGMNKAYTVSHGCEGSVTAKRVPPRGAGAPENRQLPPPSACRQAPSRAPRQSALLAPTPGGWRQARSRQWWRAEACRRPNRDCARLSAATRLCRERANALRVSFAARRDVMQHCLHLPGRQ